MIAGMTENESVYGMRLGRRPHDPARPLLRLADILTGAVPAHGVISDHLSRVTDWGLYGNDQYGDCGPTAVANSRKLTTRYLAATEESPAQDDVFDLYRRSGNPGFDPSTDTDDNGVVMADMLSAVVKGGIGGTRAVAYAAVDTSNLDEVRAAIDIFGFVLLGVDLDTAQQAQTDAGLWDYKRSPEWGGHAVLCGSYTSAARGRDLGVVTWAEVVGVTDAFATTQVPEAYVLIWPEHTRTEQFREGIDTAELNAAYMALTGRPGPFTEPGPDPAPVDPPSSDVDATLAAAMRAWLGSKGL